MKVTKGSNKASRCSILTGCSISHYLWTVPNTCQYEGTGRQHKDGGICQCPTTRGRQSKSCRHQQLLHSTRNALPTSYIVQHHGYISRATASELAGYYMDTHTQSPEDERDRVTEQCRKLPPCLNGRPTSVLFGGS